MRRERKTGKPRRRKVTALGNGVPIDPGSSSKWRYYLQLASALAGFGMIGFVVVFSTQYAQLFPAISQTVHANYRMWMIVGFVLLALAFRFPGNEREALEPSIAMTRTLFWVFMIIGGTISMYRLDLNPAIGIDVASYMNTVGGIAHLGEYPPIQFQASVYYPLGMLWKLLPQANGVFVCRLGIALLAMLTLWGLYLLGREIGGRRCGIIALALGSISKPMHVLTITSLGVTTATAGVVWFLVFTFRVFKSPTLRHFVQWGAVMGVGSYSYVPTRPWLVMIAGLIWLCFSWKAIRVGKMGYVSAVISGMMLVVIALFHVAPYLQFRGNNLLSVIKDAWIYLAASAIPLALYWRMRYSRGGEAERKVVYGVIGTMLAFMIVLPDLWKADAYSSRVFFTSRLTELGPEMPRQGFVELIGAFCKSVSMMFATGTHDDVFNGMRERIFFDFPATWAFMAGLAIFVARPSWGVALLILSVGIAIVPHSMCRIYGSSHRLAATIAPVIMIGAWSMHRVSLILSTVPKPLRWIVTAAALLLYALGMHTTTSSVIGWFESNLKGHHFPSAVYSAQVLSDSERHRVFVQPYMKRMGEIEMNVAMIGDGRGVRSLSGTEGVDIIEDVADPRRDIVFILSQGVPGILRRVESEFPGIAVQHMDYPNGVRMMRLRIPRERLDEDGSKYFRIVRRDPHQWMRTVYFGPMGFQRGMIIHQDQVMSLNVPLEVADSRSIHLDGGWVAPRQGVYRIEFETAYPVMIKVNGSVVCKTGILRRIRNHSCKVSLSKGWNRIEVAAVTKEGPLVPDIWIRDLDGGPGFLLGRSNP